jgi:hypothetical protein
LDLDHKPPNPNANPNMKKLMQESLYRSQMVQWSPQRPSNTYGKLPSQRTMTAYQRTMMRKHSLHASLLSRHLNTNTLILKV